MAVQLENEDFKRLVSILSQHGEWQMVRGRLDFLTYVFAGSKRQQDVLTQLDLDGNPKATAIHVVHRLQTFGQDEPGREALGLLVNRLISYLGGGDDVQFLENLLSKYPFHTKPVTVQPVSRWCGSKNDSAIEEKIIGENTLRHLYLLETLIDLSRCVFRIYGANFLGTGFLVGDALGITNHHVIGTREDAQRCAFEFNYQLGRDGRALPVYSTNFSEKGIFYTSPIAASNASAGELDFTIFELEKPPIGIGRMKLAPARVNSDDRVMIIQHPSGSYKKVSMQNNFVEYSDNFVVQYTTSTEPGSSGSPVLSDNCEIVGIHHAGGMLSEPASKRKYLRNEGICSPAILDELRKNAPEIYKRIA